MFWNTSLAEKIKRYYLHTYIQIPQCSGVVLVTHVTNSFVRMEDVDGNVYEVDLTLGYNLDFRLPTNRLYYQAGNFAYYLERLPFRQYQRGYGDQNFKLFRYNRQGAFAELNKEFSTLNPLANKQPYSTFEEATEKFLRTKNSTSDSIGVQSIALSHRMAISRNGIISIGPHNVGILNKKKNTIVTNSVFAHPIDDFLSETKSTVKLVVK